MPVLKIDFTDVSSFIKCSEGEHVAVLKEAEVKESQAGNEMIACVFEVAAGSSAGARVFDNFVLTEKALWRLKTYLEVVGLKADGKMKLDVDKLIGKKCIIEVGHEEYKGQEKARILAFKKLAAAPKPAATAASDDGDGEDDDGEWDDA